MKSDTFGNSTTDIVLAEHLTAHPEMAPWSCRAIAKTTLLLSNLKEAKIENKKFHRTVYSFIKCSTTKHVNSPPPHVDEKAASYTANIIHRHLMNYFREHLQGKRAAKRIKQVNAEYDGYCIRCGARDTRRSSGCWRMSNMYRRNRARRVGVRLGLVMPDLAVRRQIKHNLTR